MNLWITREESLNALKSKLSIEAHYIKKGFKIIDDLLYIFEDDKNDNFCVVCSFALLKGKNYCLSIYSLSLDGLAQEAGTLLRPAIECFELLKYFYDEPKRIKEALENRLPPAGTRAKKIDGKFKSLREHLNLAASHFSFDPIACKHLMNRKNGSLRYYQKYNETVLRHNLWTLFCVMRLLIYNAVRCIKIKNIFNLKLDKEIEEWSESGLNHAKNILEKM